MNYHQSVTKMSSQSSCQVVKVVLHSVGLWVTIAYLSQKFDLCLSICPLNPMGRSPGWGVWQDFFRGRAALEATRSMGQRDHSVKGWYTFTGWPQDKGARRWGAALIWLLTKVSLSVCNPSGRAGVRTCLIAVAVSSLLQQEMLFCYVIAKKAFHPLPSWLCSCHQLPFCPFINHPMH